MNNSGKKESAAVVFVFFAAVYMLFSRDFSPDKLLYGLDTFTIHLPFAMFAKKTIFEFHQLPVWMPDIFMGVPLIASSNLIFFYPTNLLYILLPVQLHSTYIIDIIIHMAVAAFGMKIFLKRTGVNELPALFSAFAYMLCGIFISYVYTGHWHDIKAMAMIPFTMYFINRGIAEEKLSHFFSAALFMALQVLAIGTQVMIYTYFCSGVYFVFLIYSGTEGNIYNKKKLCAYFAAATIMMVLFSSLQSLPTADYLKYSWRKDFSYNDFIFLSFRPVEAVSFILPKAFGLFGTTYWGFDQTRAFTPYLGLIPLFFIFFSFLGKSLRKTAVFFSLMSVLFLLLCFGGYTPIYKFLYYIPIFNKLRDPGRFLTILSFTVITVSAIGIDNFLKLSTQDKGKHEAPDIVLRKQLKVFVTAVAAAAGLMVLTVMNKGVLSGIIESMYQFARKAPMENNMAGVYMGMVRQDVLYFTVIFILMVLLMLMRMHGMIKSGVIFMAILCLLHYTDMHRIDSRFINYVNMDKIADQNPVIEALAKDKSIYRVMDLKFLWFPNRNIYYNTEFFAGYHGVLPYRFSKMLGNEAFYDFNVLRAFNVKYHMFNEDLKIPGLKKILDSPLKLYEDTLAKPRAFFVDRTKRAVSDQDAIDYLKSGFDPETAIVTDVMPFKETASVKKYTVDITGYTPNVIEMNAVTNKDGLLVLSNMYFPMWKAAVDGKPAIIYNVNYANMGVSLPAGGHKVKFYYDMTLMNACFFLTALAFLIYAGTIIYERRRDRKYENTGYNSHI